MLSIKATDKQIEEFAMKSPYNMIGAMIRGNPLAVYNAIHERFPTKYRNIPASSVERNDNTLHDMEMFLGTMYRGLKTDSERGKMLDFFNKRVPMLDERRALVWQYINKNTNRY